MNFENINGVTLLSDEQVFGSREAIIFFDDSKKLDVMKKMGAKCAISDFAPYLPIHHFRQ